MFEREFANRDIVYRNSSGLKVITDDEEVNKWIALIIPNQVAFDMPY